MCAPDVTTESETSPELPSLRSPRRFRAWAGIAAVSLLMLDPFTVPAQVVGVSGSTFSEMRSDMPGGAGLHGWVTTDPLGFIRLGISAGRDRGRASAPGATCTSYWPVATGCVSEVVAEENVVTSAALNLQLLAPRVFGFQVGVGPTAAFHRFGIRRVGETTGREERPVMAEGAHRRLGVGWITSVEAPRLLGDFFRFRLAVERTEVEFPACVMDVWGVCGRETLTRFSVGVGVRVGRD